LRLYKEVQGIDMKSKMFGHRLKKRADSERVAGEPYNTEGYDRGDENEDSYGYVKNKDFPQKEKGTSFGRSKEGPPGYEGKEHVKYKDPGYSSHEIRFPEDEPHMKSSVGRNEMHEMEDNYHKGVPDQTNYSLEAKLKRARMKMDAPDQEDPDPLRGNIVHNVGYEGEEDTSGEEEMGPNEMQLGMPKEKRKKMIVAITKRKMKRQ
jgi:hypothetical protein